MTGYYKVGQTGGDYVVATFYNPATQDVISKCVRDYDYADCSRDDDYLYHMEINEDIRREFLHNSGIILEGDTVEVFKGRKVKKGTIAKIAEIRPIYDRYHRWVADYAYFEDGQRTNVNNCRLIEK